MKNQITLVIVCLLSYVTTAQELSIETESVAIENLITYIIDHVKKGSKSDSLSVHNMTFLVQSSPNGLSVEDKTILKQGLKLVSKRLSEEDQISIISYSGINGIVLNKTRSKDLKKLLYAVENFKSSIKETHHDGIELAYNHAKENFSQNTKNTIVMVRNPKAKGEGNVQRLEAPKQKSNTVLITAIALLPEIISVIKD